jgi:hypothetical protein
MKRCDKELVDVTSAVMAGLTRPSRLGRSAFATEHAGKRSDADFERLRA